MDRAPIRTGLSPRRRNVSKHGKCRGVCARNAGPLKRQVRLYETSLNPYLTRVLERLLVAAIGTFSGFVRLFFRDGGLKRVPQMEHHHAGASVVAAPGRGAWKWLRNSPHFAQWNHSSSRVIAPSWLA